MLGATELSGCYVRSVGPVVTPQALKRGHIFDDLTARVKLVPFPFVEKLEFFRKL
jgi:hypothetical protein